MTKVFLALVDGIYNNVSIKTTPLGTINESWKKLKQTIGFDCDRGKYISYLRKRWVIGSSEWLAGKHGSLENYKETFDYSDSEWEYIWSTLIRDGAWDVSHIKDSSGNIVKENYAPELMLKFIAHDLRCHIVVFDLQLGITQFCSANRLKKNNAIFDSPLLMYYTGNHFQSVLPTNRKSFIDITTRFERETIPTKTVSSNVCSGEMSIANSCNFPTENKSPCEQIKKARSELNPLSADSSEKHDSEEIFTLEQLKCIKHKTDDQLRKQAQRQNKSVSEKIIQNEKDRKRSL